MARATPLRVLFVGTDNATRSQLAEALLQHEAGGWFQATSAGIAPRPVYRLTVQVLHEIGIEWGSANSKSVDEVRDQPFDYVITMCREARDTCPVLPAEAATLHWGVTDPAAVEGTPVERLAAYRHARREVATAVHRFVEHTLRTGQGGQPPSE
ncbi:MAG TPA: arsenate reductase ArsC [Candidatus Baltobacteraceae bacterium]|nr:arsenate reductase ArsC [Candidatus Baltobacteraceae bacterium]